MTEKIEPYGDHAKEIVEATEIMPTEAHPKTLMEMAGFALQRGDGLDVIEKLMDLNDRNEAKEAKRAYVKAKAMFKADAPEVTKDLKNTQYDSKYTSKGNLINTVSPVLGKYGLDASFDITQNETLITVTCILTHEQGHNESVSMNAPPDASGSKNKIQQIKSTKTYLEIATFESITGVASTNGGLDDDGNAVGQGEPEPIDQDGIDEIEKLMKKAGIDTPEKVAKLKNRMQELYKTPAIDRLDTEQAKDLIGNLKETVKFKAKKVDNL